LAAIAGMQSLRELNLNYCRFTDKGLVQLSSLSGLQRLELARTKITGAAVKTLAGHLSNLVELNLSYTPMDDSVLAVLKGLPHLEVLRLDSTGVSDAGVEELRSIAGLKLLDVYHTGVSEKAFGQLKAALPACQV